MEIKTKLAVTCFLHNDDDYLLLLRDKNREVDPGKLNGIGGKVEDGENFVQTAIRETYEESGYTVTEDNIKLKCIVQLNEDNNTLWIMAFFKVEVGDKKIPIGNKTREGELMWIPRDEILNTEFELVDDINYVFKDIVEGDQTTFMYAKMDEKFIVIDKEISRIKK